MCIAVCGAFRPELEAVLASSRLGQDVAMAVLPIRCEGEPWAWADVLAAVRGAGHACDSVEVWGSRCVPEGAPPASCRGRVEALHACQALLSTEACAELPKGAMVVTPGWLRHWRARVKQWGFFAALGPLQFRESVSRLIMLDAGVDPDAHRLLAEAATLTGLDAVHVTVGLEELTARARATVLRWSGAAPPADGESVLPYRARVLLMEHSPLVRAATERALEYLGCKVQVARDGEDAVARYAEAQRRGEGFDVVLLDLAVAGGMGGVEALRRLADLDPAVKAVCCGGYAGEAVMAQPADLGFSGALHKPYSAAELGELLQRVLSGTRG